jgi:benzoate membrane transport protein
MALLKDISLSALIAGFVCVLVGFTSSAVIVFQAAHALGATDAEVGSWMWALGLGMGVTSIGLSLRYRVPVATAWSTPGAALLITSTAGISMPDAIGAFVVTGLLITLVGFSGWFERAMRHLPMSLATGMLAGILLRFGLDAFGALKTSFGIVFPMFCVYLGMRRVRARYAVIAALITGALIAAAQGKLQLGGISLALAHPVWTTPHFSLGAIIGVALPLFIVTMASQNMPGVATIRASGFNPPVSPLIGWTGAATVLLAPFGAYALNLAAITAAICLGREAHEESSKRYVAAMAAGLIYCVVGLFGATVAAVFAAFPRELVLAIAGLALLGTIGNALTLALHEERSREAALVTFLVTASGLSLLGIGAAFWGLLAGVLALTVQSTSAAKLRAVWQRLMSVASSSGRTGVQ